MSWLFHPQEILSFAVFKYWNFSSCLSTKVSPKNRYEFFLYYIFFTNLKPIKRWSWTPEMIIKFHELIFLVRRFFTPWKFQNFYYLYQGAVVWAKSHHSFTTEQCSPVKYFAVCLNVLFTTHLDLPETYFWPQTNTSHLTLSVQTPYYWIDLKASVNWMQIVKIYSSAGLPHGWKFLGYTKFRSKTTNHGQLAWPFELHVKQTPSSITCDWLFFFLAQIRSLAVSDPVFSIQHHFSLKYRSYHSILWWYPSGNRKRKLAVFENGKIEDFLCKKKPACCIVPSRD